MAVHDLIEDPDNAFMSVFGYLLGAGVGRAGFRKAAMPNRGMSSKKFDSLGNVKGRLVEFDNVRALTCPV
jgi:hypothetical protein